jgi:ribonucleoside-diphosphate reductase alpha chain
MMGTLTCDHPDVDAFIAAKEMPGTLAHFNLSVLISDAFMGAVEHDADWQLRFPSLGIERLIKARALWDSIVRHAYDGAEPGVLFIDRIRREDNLAYAETISATNPCGEVRAWYGARSGLAQPDALRANLFTTDARLVVARWLTSLMATRMLDNAHRLRAPAAGTGRWRRAGSA